MTGTKVCPYCGEEVKAAAIKCKHCHSILSEEDNALVGAAAPAKPVRQAVPKAKKPIWKRWWAWAAVTAVTVGLFLLIASLGGGDKDTSTTTPSSTPSSEESKETTSPKTVSDEFKPLEIKDSGYIVSNGYLFYAVIMHNPNEKFAVEFPTYRITARDDSDQVIGTEDQVLSFIYPQQDFAFGSLGFQLDQQPTKVDFMALEPRDYNITAVEMLEHPIFIPLEVVGANKRGDSILGEISNPNSYDIDSAVVTAIFRDANGKIIGGESTFIDKLPAGGKTPFELRAYSTWITDNYAVYANIW
jgi:hypothetical protein